MSLMIHWQKVRRWTNVKEMGLRKSFRIEKKICVVDYAKEHVEVSEKSKSLEVMVAVDTHLAKWLMSGLRILLGGCFLLGFMGSKKGKTWIWCSTVNEIKVDVFYPCSISVLLLLVDSRLYVFYKDVLVRVEECFYSPNPLLWSWILTQIIWSSEEK